MGNFGSSPFKKQDLIVFCPNRQQQLSLKDKVFQPKLNSLKTSVGGGTSSDSGKSLDFCEGPAEPSPSILLCLNQALKERRNHAEIDSKDFKRGEDDILILNDEESDKLWDYMRNDSALGANPLRFRPNIFFDLICTRSLGRCLMYSRYTSSTQTLMKE